MPSVASAVADAEGLRKRKREKWPQKDATEAPAPANTSHPAVADAPADTRDSAVAGFLPPNQSRGPTQVFYVTPEWKGPLVEGAEGAKPGQPWTWLGDESMHPFWCVRRLPRSKLSEGDFNMEYKHITFTTVVVGCVAGKAASVAASVSVPFLTNTVNLEADTQLVFEVEEPEKKNKKRKHGNIK